MQSALFRLTRPAYLAPGGDCGRILQPDPLW